MGPAYKPPPGGLYVPDPRTIGDIIVRSLAIQAFSICAYAHLASLLPLNSIPRVVVLQIVLFTAFPEFVLVQLLTYGTVALYAIIFLWLNSKPAERTVPDAENSRHDIPVDSADQIKDAAAISPPLAIRLLVLALNCLPLIATIFAYKQRLGIGYLAATYVGNLKIDHRNGWIAIGGLVAAGMTLTILLTNYFYLKHAKIPERMRTIKVPISVVLLQMGIAVSVHQFLLEATNHPTLISQTFAWPTLYLVATLGLISLRSPKWRPVLYAVAGFVVAATAVSQLHSDIQELVDISNNRVQPYNYRWKVKDLVSARSSAS